MSEVELQIDKEFKHLIVPLSKQEYLKLESDILQHGCRESIKIWNGKIVDGHNRYEICCKHNIPFEVFDMDFDCREYAIFWICFNQLKRSNLTEETNKFLIGMEYEAKKIVNSKRNNRGKNKYTEEDIMGNNSDKKYEYEHRTAESISNLNHISITTVTKYASFARALEEIGKKEPALVSKILSGKYKISHKNTLAIALLKTQDVIKLNKRIEDNPLQFLHYKSTRNAMSSGKFDNVFESKTAGPSVKDMPAFDPDAEINSLSLTIPSWVSSINRIKTRTNFNLISSKAKSTSKIELENLLQSADDFLTCLKEN